MQVTRKCFIDGKINVLDIPSLTPLQYAEGEANRAEGMLVQDAYPHLSPAEREFILTGILPDDWDRLFSDEGDDEMADEEYAYWRDMESDEPGF